MQTKSSDLGPGSSAGLQTRDGFRFETPRGETSRPRSQARRGPRPAAPPGRHPCTLLWREGKSRVWSRPGTASHQDPASRSFPRVPLVPGQGQKETSGGGAAAERSAEQRLRTVTRLARGAVKAVAALPAAHPRIACEKTRRWLACPS